jgi:hypothetical protein
MDYTQYQNLFDEILNTSEKPAPYDNQVYLDYTKLNRSRMKRWNKQLTLDEGLVKKIKEISKPQHWIIITEPWCGDAAHIIPFLIQMTALNKMITYEIQLRDNEPFTIENYLTNGTKSIPILIVRGTDQNDLFVWGPRPKGAAAVMENMKKANADFETTKIELQNWYNNDGGESLAEELSLNFSKL